ncbi:MAG: HAMP domain-containing protein, partial [Anaerolineales bacterium]|nr:HAMP domain-containing protein [Anaerolineales bacterium]
MTRSLAFKLTIAFWLVSLIGVSLVAFFAVRATSNEFDTLQNDRTRRTLVDQLAGYYATSGSWDGVGATLQLLTQDTQTPFAVADLDQNIVLPGPGFPTNRQLPVQMFENGTPIEVNGETVGVLLMPEFVPGDPFPRDRRTPFNPEEAFLERINNAVVWAAGGATAVSLIIGFFLARTLTRPIKELTQATKLVAAGNLGQKVEIHANDELGDLAASFNQMSADLMMSRDQRRQMTADIAHDLRTPLSLILGHSEAIRDGVLPPTPETFDIVHDEAQRLNRLIEDLR